MLFYHMHNIVAVTSMLITVCLCSSATEGFALTQRQSMVICSMTALSISLLATGVIAYIRIHPPNSSNPTSSKNK